MCARSSSNSPTALEMASHSIWLTAVRSFSDSDLLVAQSPFPDEMDDYTVALPPTGWYDYWTGSRVSGSSGRKGIDNAPVPQAEIKIHRTLDTLPVFVRAGAIIPQQPLVQSTDEKPEGPLTLRVYPPSASGEACSGNIYLDDGVSYDFKKGEYLRDLFTCRLTAQGLIVTVAPRQGTFPPWWNLLSIEVYGAAKPVSSATVTALNTTAANPISAGYDAEHHRITALVNDDGQGARTATDILKPVFSLTKPTAAAINESLVAAAHLPPSQSSFLALQTGLKRRAFLSLSFTTFRARSSAMANLTSSEPNSPSCSGSPSISDG